MERTVKTAYRAHARLAEMKKRSSADTSDNMSKDFIWILFYQLGASWVSRRLQGCAQQKGGSTFERALQLTKVDSLWCKTVFNEDMLVRFREQVVIR